MSSKTTKRSGAGYDPSAWAAQRKAAVDRANRLREERKNGGDVPLPDEVAASAAADTSSHAAPPLSSSAFDEMPVGGGNGNGGMNGGQASAGGDSLDQFYEHEGARVAAPPSEAVPGKENRPLPGAYPSPTGDSLAQELRRRGEPSPSNANANANANATGGPGQAPFRSQFMQEWQSQNDEGGGQPGGAGHGFSPPPRQPNQYADAGAASSGGGADDDGQPMSSSRRADADAHQHFESWLREDGAGGPPKDAPAPRGRGRGRRRKQPAAGPGWNDDTSYMGLGADVQLPGEDQAATTPTKKPRGRGRGSRGGGGAASHVIGSASASNSPYATKPVATTRPGWNDDTELVTGSFDNAEDDARTLRKKTSLRNLKERLRSRGEDTGQGLGSAGSMRDLSLRSQSAAEPRDKGGNDALGNGGGSRTARARTGGGSPDAAPPPPAEYRTVYRPPAAANDDYGDDYGDDDEAYGYDAPAPKRQQQQQQQPPPQRQRQQQQPPPEQREPARRQQPKAEAPRPPPRKAAAPAAAAPAELPGGFGADLPPDAFAAPDVPMGRCAHCDRNMNLKALARHEPICQKTFMTKRKKFDTQKARVEGTEAAQFVAENKRKEKKAGKKGGKPPGKAEGGNAKWKQQSSALREAMEANRAIAKAEKKAKDTGQAYVAPVVAKKSAAATEADVAASGFVKCPTCNRSFNATAAERHIPKCSSISAKPKRLMRGSGTQLGSTSRKNETQKRTGGGGGGGGGGGMPAALKRHMKR